MIKSFLPRGLLALALLLPVPALAQDLVPVPKGDQVKIDAHGTCRIVSNSGGNDVMVATRTAAEWSSGTNSFLTNISDIPGLTAKDCSRTTTNVKWRANFQCPNAYDRQDCRGRAVSADGNWGYVLEHGDSGQNAVRLHFYQINEKSNTVARAFSLSGLSDYPTVVQSVVASADGSVVATWERKFSDNGGYQTELVAYKVSGNSAVRSGSARVPSGSRGGYTPAAMSDDGQFILVDKYVYRFTGSALVQVSIGGTDIDNADGQSSGFDNKGKWIERLGAFLQVDSHGLNGYLVGPNSAGAWQRAKVFSRSGQAGDGEFIDLDVNDAGTKALLMRGRFKSKDQYMDVFSISGRTFTLRTSQEIDRAGSADPYSGVSSAKFSSGEGNFIMLSGLVGPEIRQYDARKLNIESLPILNRIATPLALRSGAITELSSSANDQLLVTYQAGGSEPEKFEVISLMEE